MAATASTLADTVAATHPTYTDAEEQWQTVDDLCGGPLCVKRAGERYLPKLHDQTNKDYEAYKCRATLVNAVKRTREALTGMLMRKRPEIAFPDEAIEKLTADITLAGHTIWDWLRMVAEQVNSNGRCATLIDWSEQGRPYMAVYKARDILNWAQTRENGAEKLLMLVLRETDDELGDDQVVRTITRIRRYFIKDGIVMQDLWKEDVDHHEKTGRQVGGAMDTGGGFKLEDDEKPLKKNGKPLTAIPAICHNASHLGWEIGEIPLYDLAEINVSHYRTTADLENGRHLCGLPTLTATGVDSGQGDIMLGSAKALTSEDANAQFQYLEFTGQGLKALETAITEKEKQMGDMGARLLFNQTRDAEAFETVQLRATSETAALANISGHMSATTTQALQWFIWWATPGNKAPEDFEAPIVMSTDFVTATITPELLTGLTAALQTGSISKETYFYQLQKGEIYPEDWDLEKEVRAIAQAPPMTPPSPAPGTPPEKDPTKKPPTDDE